MTVLVSLVISVCSPIDPAAIKAKMAELERKNDGAKVSLRLDRKCLGLPKGRAK